MTLYFAAYTDDGSRIYVDGVLEAEQWREQGSTWSPYTRHFNTSVR
jgi:single-stranded DNA-binding protein